MNNQEQNNNNSKGNPSWDQHNKGNEGKDDKKSNPGCGCGCGCNEK